MVSYFSLALNNLRRRGIRSWLTLLGIFIGILAVISLITLGTGLKTAVNAQFGVSSTQMISVQAGGLNYGAPGTTVANPLTRDDVEAINRLGSVEYTLPRNIELLRVEYNNKVRQLYASNLIEGFEDEMYDMLDLEIEKGQLLRNGNLGRVIIGNKLYLGENNGFDKNLEIGRTFLIEDKKFTIEGVLKPKGSFILDNIILVYDDALDNIVDYGDKVDLIGVKVKNKDLMDKAKQDIEKLMRDRRNVDKGEEDFEVSTPESALEQVNSVLNAIQIFIVVIASISIVVGAIGIVNTMATAVVERRKEIGIMKAVGARNNQIFIQFFIESGFMGLVGGILGIIFGLLIGYFGTKFINDWIGANTTPFLITLFSSFPLIILTLIGSFLVGAIAGIVPAMNAARENPVEALRG